MTRPTATAHAGHVIVESPAPFCPLSVEEATRLRDELTAALAEVASLRRRPDDVPGVVHRIVTKQEQLDEIDAETRDGGSGPKGAA